MKFLRESLANILSDVPDNADSELGNLCILYILSAEQRANVTHTKFSGFHV